MSNNEIFAAVPFTWLLIFFLYIFCGELESVDHSFAYVVHFVGIMSGFEPRELP